ncbi:PAS domain S-box protein [Oscillatoria sp. FACHB-1406]|uniref:sensor domain-containing protein n=1 Tax=Oscillatoria sp. FACHB-1406 TaxID=2692846 RepID=UPI001A7EB6B8|nr:PAS domain S-box protein [Oscillatoria sp. FACHB-1406]
MSQLSLTLKLLSAGLSSQWAEVSRAFRLGTAALFLALTAIHRYSTQKGQRVQSPHPAERFVRFPSVPLAKDEQLHLLQRAIEASSSGVVICDARADDLPIVYLNAKFEELTGYSRAEVLGKNCRFLQKGDRAQPSLDIIRRALREGQDCHTILRNYRKDGSLFWNELYLAPVRDNHGTLTHFIGIQTDVSERQQLLENLHASQERLSAILELASDAIISADSTGRIELFNQAAERLFGYQRDAILGQPLEKLLPDGDRILHVPASALLPSQSLEMRARHQDGSEFLAEVSMSQLELQEGKILTIILRDITAYKKAEEALLDSKAQLSAILNATSDGLVVLDDRGSIRFANPAAANLFGRSISQLLNWDLGLPFISCEWVEIALVQPSKKIVVAEMQVTETTWDRERVYLVSLRDITQRKHAEEQLRESEEKYRRIVETAAEGIWTIDRDHNTTFVNSQMAEMVGYSVAEMKGKNIFDFIDSSQDALMKRHLLRRHKKTEEKYDFQLRRKDGSLFWVAISTRPLFDSDGHYAGALKMIADINDRKQAEAQLRYNAYYDPLTNLPNRTLFLERLAHTIRRSRRRSGYPYAVFFLDLDDFKVVNDSLGHMMGDQLLVAIARRLESCLQPSEILARLGGDEFTILTEGLRNRQDVISIAQKIHRAFRAPLYLQERDLFINVSIGIAFGNPDYTYSEELLRDADAAMYSAKASGKGRYAIFDREMHETVLMRFQLETDLRLALERQEFLLYYQPIFDLASGHLAGFEALVRWQHPERGFIGPQEFIPVAEQTGFIVPLGWWILQEACAQIASWQKQFACKQPLTIAVNLSGKQLKEADIVKRVRNILEQTELEGSALKLEMVESLLMEDTEATLQTLAQLRAMQVQLVIDDFGTGYSSLSYLHRFPVSALKIDRSFVLGLERDSDNGEIIKAVASLARALKMNTIAEGIETKEQLAYIKGIGCQYGQGYLFARPLEPQAAAALISRSLLDE